MRYQHSEAVDRATYRDDGLAGNMQLRVHSESHKEVTGTLRAQRDWNRLVNPVKNYRGGLGDRFSFMSATVPECLPERLELLAYANEYAFLYDDQMEQLDLKNFQEGRDEMLHMFAVHTIESTNSDHVRPERVLQLQIFAEMMAIDHDRAIITMEAWAKFIDLASRTRVEPFDTLEEYLPNRAIDAGELFWFGILTFAMALTIPESELEICMRLARPGYEAISLVNDIYSWRKERLDAIKAGQDYVYNAIWVVAREQRCGEEEAIAFCRNVVRQRIQQFDAAVKTAHETELSQNTLHYLEAVRLSHVGNLVWSIYCPRYHEVNYYRRSNL